MRPPVERIRNRVEVPFAEGAKACSLAKDLKPKAVGVLVGASLLGLCGVAEVDLHTGVHRQGGVGPLVCGVQPAARLAPDAYASGLAPLYEPGERERGGPDRGVNPGLRRGSGLGVISNKNYLIETPRRWRTASARRSGV